jgi:predicted PurR-regulated permease PerM
MADASRYPSDFAPRALKWTIFLGWTVLVVYLCLQILAPFTNVIAWAAVLTVTFYPVHRYLVTVTGRVAVSALLTSALVVIAVVIPLLFLLAVAVEQFLALGVSLQEAFGDEGRVNAASAVGRVYLETLQRFGVDSNAVAAWIRQHASELTRLGAEYTMTLAASVTGAVASFVFIIFAMFLLFRDGERMVAKATDLLPFERARSELLLLRIRDAIYGGVYGVVVIALMQGALCGGMFWILGVPSAALWGMVTVLTSVLPLFGAAAVWAPGTFYLFITGHWPQAVVLAVWGIVAVSGIDNFLRPRLVGGRVGLSEVVIFFSLLGGLQVFGLLGIVLGPLLFAVAASIVDVLNEPRV